LAYVRFNLAIVISNNLFTFLIMKNRTIIVWVILVLLTIAVGVISSLSLSNAAIVIIVLSVIKFIGVSFYFMELKKAHVFWKASVLIYLLLFSTIVLITI